MKDDTPEEVNISADRGGKINYNSADNSINIHNNHFHKNEINKSEEEVVEYFKNISSYGRIWPRNIKNYHFNRSETYEIIKLLESNKLILLSGAPGAGKTCVLLDTLDILEEDNNITVIFLQGRELRISNFEELKNNLLHIASIRSVTIVIDSLDVLSISGDKSIFEDFLSLIYYVKNLANVKIIAACREFDIKYDIRLANIDWSANVRTKELDYDSDVVPFLASLQIDAAQIGIDQQNLICNPRMLGMYVDVCLKGGVTNAVTPVELSKNYLDIVIIDDLVLGDVAYDAILRISAIMVEKRQLNITREQLNSSFDLTRKLLSAGIIVKTGDGCYTFGHQTLVDTLVIIKAIQEGISLSDFILQQKPVPFIRPIVRAFVLYLRTYNPTQFSKQMRAAIDNEQIAFHIKRLIVSTFAELTPHKDDWLLFKHMFTNSGALFEVLFQGISTKLWSNFLEENFSPLIKLANNAIWHLRYVEKFTSWEGLSANEFVTIWLEVFSCSYINKKDASYRACWAIGKFNEWQTPNIDTLFQKIITNIKSQDVDIVGKPLSLWVDATNMYDDLLWDFITKKLDRNKDDNNNELLCAEHIFYDKSFFPNRLKQSKKLLSLAIKDVDNWSNKLNNDGIGRHFLQDTSHENRRVEGSIRHYSSFNLLFDALENAIVHHAATNTAWWQENVSFLLNSKESALRYFAILGLDSNPDANVQYVKQALLNVEKEYNFRYELGILLNKSAPLLDFESLGQIQQVINNLYKEETSLWVWDEKRNILIELPAMYRTKESQNTICTAEKIFGPATRKPRIHGGGGIVVAHILRFTCLL